MRIWEIAKQLGLTSKDILYLFPDKKSSSSRVEDIYAESVIAALSPATSTSEERDDGSIH